jgi:hypothetical protein
MGPKMKNNNSKRDLSEEQQSVSSSSCNAKRRKTTNIQDEDATEIPFIIDLVDNSQIKTEELDVNMNDYDNDDVESAAVRTKFPSDDSDSKSYSSNEADPKWSCPNCTLVNDSKAFACIMCGTTMCEAILKREQMNTLSQSPTNTFLMHHDDNNNDNIVDENEYNNDNGDNVNSDNHNINHNSHHHEKPSNYERCWTCAKCTFAQNSASSLLCEMCGSENKLSEEIKLNEEIRRILFQDFMEEMLPKPSPTAVMSSPLTPTRSSYSSNSSSSVPIVTPYASPVPSNVNRYSHSPLASATATSVRSLLADENNNAPPVDDDIDDWYRFSLVKNEGNHQWYDAVLNQCNIINNSNNNKYYRIQLLQMRSTGNFYVWTRWGRVGDSSTGRAMKGPYSNEEDAIRIFAKKYRDKTGNKWGEAKFVPKHKKYTKIEIDHQIMVKTNFRTLTGFNLKVKELPLGVLSREQIQIGVSVLNRIKDKLNGEDVSQSYPMLSSEFYTAIPHSFGRSTRPPVISNISSLNQCYTKCRKISEEVQGLRYTTYSRTLKK